MKGAGARLLVVLLAGGALPGAARADGLTGLLEADFRRSLGRYQDQAGTDYRQDVNAFGQRLRLTLDRTLFPNLRFTAGGAIENLASSTAPVNFRLSGAQLAQLNAALILTGNVFNASAAYSRRMQFDAGFADPQGTGLINESATLHLSWREPGAPSVALLVSRPAQYDTRRQLADRSALEVLLTSAWSPLPRLSLQYSGSFSDGQDHLRNTATFVTTNTARAGYLTTMFDGRTTLAASIQLAERSSAVRSAGPGGTLETVQSTIGGLSLIETFPNTADRSTLLANAALVDGNTTEPAGINLGTSAVVAGEAIPRDLGAEFGPPFPTVNRIFVWVDRPLPSALSSAFQWEAYQSEDNLAWSPLPVDGAVVFSVFQNRFEIPIPRTTARFLKVVTRPLPLAVTTDPQFSDVHVTELQPVLVEPVPPTRSWAHSAQTTMSASARTRITDELFHDVSAQLGLAGGAASDGTGTYLLSNGLTYSRQLGAAYFFSGRLARQDTDYGRGRQGVVQLGLSLAANWLPSLGGNVSYSAQVLDGPLGWGSTQSVSLLGRAIPYRNLAAQLGLSLGLNVPAQGAPLLSDVVTVALSAQPHPRVSVTGSYGHNATRRLSGAVRPVVSERVDGNVTFNPFPALYLHAGAGWSLQDGRGTPLANAALGFSPFRGGDLQLGLAFTQTLDTTGGVSQMLTPTIRWNIRRGLLLTASYTLLDSETLTQRTRSQSFGATLQLML